MDLKGIVTIRPDQCGLLKRAATMMGTSFLEEMWFTTWLSALDSMGATRARKEELMHAVFMDDLVAHAPYQGVYALSDMTAATGAYRYSELNGMTHSDIEAQEGAFLQNVATPQELALLDKQGEKMEPISEFDWARVFEDDRDHIYFYAWAVDPGARGTGALRRLLEPFFAFADENHLNCYLDCYADHLQRMYEHLGFELIDELRSPEFEVYERRMVRKAR
ncbi:MAG: GNAT family N-acetyltransferase [Eggerthellaceae bacterium]